MAPRPIILVLVIIATVFATSSHQASALSENPIGAVTAAPEGPVLTEGRAAVKPTIVLVHGAFADSAGWNDVSLMLLEKGYRVHAWANPLRGLTTDAAYLRDFLSTVDGPVVLVGHSYGGAVITEAATGNENI
jgi:pimeloyl-ACP methyl ester carboxylesterase